MTKILLTAGAVLAVLALLVLVPSSPAVMVEYEHTMLWSSGVDEWGYASAPMITGYSVMIAVGAALAMALTVWMGKRRQLAWTASLGLALVSGAAALVCSHWLFCALRWGYIVNDLGASAAFIFQFWEGGYTMYGAILGGLLGAYLYARVRKTNVGDVMDAIMPGAVLLVAMGRAAECFTSQGMGTYVVNEALDMLPFVQSNEWGDGVLVPVYIYEAIVAFAAFAAMLVMSLKGKPLAGRIAETGLTIISAAQVMLDSWRGDELIRFGFVRLNMIAAAVTLLALMILRVIRAVKADGKATWWTILRVVLLFLGAAVVLIVEFGLDGKMGITASNTLLYAIQTAAVIMMGAVVLIDGRKRA